MLLLFICSLYGYLPSAVWLFIHLLHIFLSMDSCERVIGIENLLIFPLMRMNALTDRQTEPTSSFNHSITGEYLTLIIASTTHIWITTIYSMHWMISYYYERQQRSLPLIYTIHTVAATMASGENFYHSNHVQSIWINWRPLLHYCYYFYYSYKLIHIIIAVVVSPFTVCIAVFAMEKRFDSS